MYCDTHVPHTLKMMMIWYLGNKQELRLSSDLHVLVHLQALTNT